MTSPAPLTATEKRMVSVGAAIVALTRFIPLSKGPWDWDEVLFCLAVGNYDVGIHQPHPPGFPLYIFLGRIARVFTSSDFHALQAVNVIAAMLAFPVMFALARAFRLDFLLSFFSALLFAFLPNVWFFGGTAFSDVPAMVLFLAAIAVFLFSMRSGSANTYFAASAILAAAILVRPQNGAVAIYPWALATYSFVRARRVRVAALGVSLTAAMTLIGYGIAAAATGFEAYARALYFHSRYVKQVDSVSAAARPPLVRVLGMILDPYQAGKVSILINVLALIAIVYAITRAPRRPVADILLTFAPVMILLTLAANPLGSSRFSLSWMPGVVMLAALGSDALARVVPRFRVAAVMLVLGVILGRLIPWTLPAFEQPRRNDSPPVLAAKWIAAHVPATSTVFVDESIWPWAKYFIPNHRQVRPQDPSKISSYRESANGVFISMESPLVEGQRTFARPRNRTWNIVTQRCFEAYVVPTREMASFDSGWWPLEGDWPNVWRWSSKRASIRFPPMRAPAELRLRFEAPVDVLRHPVRITFSLNGHVIGTHVATRLVNDVRYVVMPRPNQANVLRIDVSDTFIPVRRGMSDDWRQLGIMLRSWEWRPAAARDARKAS